MAKLVSKTYGDALFELAVSQNRLDELFEEAKGLVTVFSENQEFTKFLNHPKIAKEEKMQFMKNIFEDTVSADMMGFLTLIVRKDRQNEILHILDYFISEVKEYKKIGVAYVTTAVELSEQKKKEVTDRLKATTSYEQFEMNYTVDSSLVGGMIIRIGDKVVDSSIKNKINELSKALYKIQLS